MSNAQLVKELRAKTGARISDCNTAIKECAGDLVRAEEWLKVKNLARGESQQKETPKEGRLNMMVDLDNDKVAIVELLTNTDFAAKSTAISGWIQEFANAALESNAQSAEDLASVTLICGRKCGDVVKELAGLLGESVAFGRVKVVSGTMGHYMHSDCKQAAVVVFEGNCEGNELAVGKDLAMHAVFAKPRHLTKHDVPQSKIDELNSIIQKRLEADKDLQSKPDSVKEKIAQGMLNTYYRDHCLMEQPYFRDGKGAISDKVKEKLPNAKIKEFHLFVVGG